MLVATGLHRLNVGPIDLVVESGACVCLMGSSGAGKSVVLRMIADLDPHQGTVTLDGIDALRVSAPLWRRRVTYVPADSGWWSSIVGDHFEFGADHAGNLASLALAEDAMSWPVMRLSTGERQRLALLRAVRVDTRMLLLDEPTSGLDAMGVDRVESFLQRQRQKGIGILMVTHDAAQATRMASRRLYIDGGQLRAIT